MPLPLLPISLVLAAACALINLWLQVRIGQVRKQHGVWVGDAGNEAVVRRVRAQANFVENAPFVLVLVALIELCVGPNLLLLGLAVVFLLARLAHPIGMDGIGRARMIGAVLTMAVQLLLAIWAEAIPIVAARDGQNAAPVETAPPAG